MPQNRRKISITAPLTGLFITLLTGLISLGTLSTVFALFFFCFVAAENSCNPTPVLRFRYKKAVKTIVAAASVPALTAKNSNPAKNMSSHTPSRIVLYAADIRLLTGCSRRSSQRQIVQLKERLQRQAHEYVTIEEYCQYRALSYQKTLIQLKLL